MPSDAFQWVASSGGSWTTAASWVDESTGTTASRSPGTADSATIQGATGAHVQVLAGNGAAAQANFVGNTNIFGTLAIGTLSVGSGSVLGALSAVAGATLTASTGTVLAGDLSASNSAGLVAIAGLLSIGTGGQGIAGPAVEVGAANGGTLRLGGLVGTGGSLTVLSTSGSGVVEIGTLGHAAAGVITVDAGAQLSGNLTVNLGGSVVDNGVIAAAGGTLAIGAVGGTGTLVVDDNATLSLQGRPAGALAVSLAGTNATLQLGAEADLPGTLTGFTVGDALDFAASQISAASWSQTASGSGVLTLSYGGTTAAQVHLVGNYAADVFLTSSDGAGGTDITVAATGSGGGTAVSGGTAGPDAYAWTKPGQSGAWTTAGDWTDSTVGAPAQLGPGSKNAVTIDGGGGNTFQVIGGNAVVASLALFANTALVGHVATGTLVLGNASAAGNLDLLAGGTLSAGAAALANGELSLDGSSTAASLTTLAIGGGQSGVGLPTTTLSVADGATLRLGALSLGGGQSNLVETDSTGAIVIGGGAGTAGAITVAAGIDVLGNGSLNSAGAVFDQGTITASGGTLMVGAVSGTGTLAIAGNATLQLEAGSTAAVSFAGSNATLALQTPASITGTLFGEAPGDVIDILGSPITGATWQAGGAAAGLLSLTYDGQVAATLALAGNYAGQVFSTTSDGAQGTDILLTQPASGGSGSGGPGSGSAIGADTYLWQGSGNGSWSNAANWYDETLGATATSAPGSLASVAVTGLTNSSVMQLDGPAAAASLSLVGNVNFVGTLTAGSLSVGLGTLTSSLALISGNRASVASLTIGNGAINLYGSGSALTVSGELTLGTSGPGVGEPRPTLQATYGATLQAGGLALAGNAVLLTDTQSSLEVGTVGGAALNALTIDSGITVSGAGSLQAAHVVDNGVLRASGGTLMVGGVVSGLGALQIDAGATLNLAGSAVSSNAITFTAPDGTLQLAAAATAPSGTLSGFAAGDSLIIDGGSVDAASYSSLSPNLGTLTLTADGNPVGHMVLAGNYSGDYFAVETANGIADIVLATDGSATGTSTGGTSTGGTSTGGTSTGGTSTGGTSTGGTSTGGTSTGGTSTGGTSTGGTSTGGTSTGGTSTGGTSTGGTSTGGTSTGGTSTGGTSTGGTSTGGTSTGGTSTGGTSTGGTSTGGTSTGGTSTGGTSTGGTSTGGTSTGGTSTGGTSTGGTSTGGTSTGGTSTGGTSTGGTSTGGTSTGGTSTGGTSTGGTSVSGTSTGGTGTSGAAAANLLAAYLAAEPTYRAQEIKAEVSSLTSGVQAINILTSPSDTPNAADVDLAILDLDGQLTHAYTLADGVSGALLQGSEPATLNDTVGGGLLVANNGTDNLVAVDPGGDLLVGGGGNTTFYALPNSQYDTAQTTDTVIGGSGHDEVVTGLGQVFVSTGVGGSLLFLGAGFDTVTDNGNDTVVMTNGNDTINANAASTIFGGSSGEFTLHEGAGPGSEVVLGAGTGLIYGGSGAGGTVFGGSNSLQLVGGTGAETIVCGSGESLIYGGTGGDVIYGGTGVGVFHGANAPTEMVVGSGPSTVFGGDQNEIFASGPYNNQFNAGAGNESLIAAGASGSNEFYVGTGNDLIYGGSGSDAFVAGSGNATVAGDGGNNLYQAFAGQAGGSLVVLDFTPGRDFIDLVNYSQSVNDVLAAQVNAGGNTGITLQDGTQMVFAGVSHLNASSFV